MKSIFALAVLLLSGCFQAAGPLDDRGELPEDIAAPSPRFLALDSRYMQSEPWRVTGQVLLPTGEPAQGARVWIEGADLRRPVNNAAEYLAIRAESLQTTQADGTFSYRIDDGLFAVSASLPGYYVNRTAARSVAQGSHLEITLTPVTQFIVAHRRASYYAPENTLAAIQKAALLGATAVEIDVRLTQDGQLVAVHDPTLERTTNGHGAVNTTGWSVIASLDAGSSFDASFASAKVPRLADILETSRDLGVHVLLDVKASAKDAVATRERLVNEILAADAGAYTSIIAFRKATVMYCAESGLSCGYLSNGTVDARTGLETALRLGASMFLVNQTALVPGLHEEAQHAGIRLFAWTANHKDQWQAIQDVGVDGIITDRPESLARWLAGT